MVIFTRSCSPMEAGGGRVDVGRRSSIRPLHTRKLRCPFLLVQETISLLVMRHQAGSSTSTVESVERISRRPPRSIGSM